MEIYGIYKYKRSEAIKDAIICSPIYIIFCGIVAAIVGVFVSLFWGCAITNNGFSPEIVMWFAIAGVVLGLLLAYMVSSDVNKESAERSNLKYLTEKIDMQEKQQKSFDELSIYQNAYAKALNNYDAEIASKKQEMEAIVKKYID